MSNRTAIFVLIVIVVILCAASGGHKSIDAAPSSPNDVTSYIQQKFGVYSSQALTIAKCESGYDPSAVNVTTPVYVDGVPEHAVGVFQFLPSTFKEVSTGNILNYRDNIDAAYALFVRDGYSWREWECKPY
jgi:transglycosylase-like protein with SLT domain